jgi:hypothetical protein
MLWKTSSEEAIRGARMKDPMLEAFADKLVAAIKERDFSDDWGPYDVQQSCYEMVHEVLEDFYDNRGPKSALQANRDYMERRSNVSGVEECRHGVPFGQYCGYCADANRRGG